MITSSGSEFVLSSKYADYLRFRSPVEFLEGTTFAGKTTVAILKFMIMVAESPKKQHIISGLDTGTIEKNIIQKDFGILDVFGNSAETPDGLCEYHGKGSPKYTLPHILFRTGRGVKVIFVLGYDDEKRWKKALGGQYGVVYVDECNIANMNYFREISMRCDHLIGTLNPDDPNREIYTQYINCSRPVAKYEDDGPAELRAMLDAPHKKGWTWWFFGFDDNPSLTPEKKKQIIDNVPVGTKQYYNKILGLRTKATGLVFTEFSRKRHVLTEEQIAEIGKSRRDKDRQEYFVVYTSGLDTSYSQISSDTVAMSFTGITSAGKCIVLREKVLSNKGKRDTEVLAPSDVVKEYVAFLDRCRTEFGYFADVFVDCADQATRTELLKEKARRHLIYNFNHSYKKITVNDRIEFILGWMKTGHYFVSDTCTVYIRELETYSWDEKKENVPEDRNNHMIDSANYGWIPYRKQIGKDGTNVTR